MKTNYLNQLLLLPTSHDVTNQRLVEHLNTLNRAASEVDFAVASAAEKALIEQVVGWLLYADVYRQTTGFGIGDDVDLAPGWVLIGHGLRDMLHSSHASLQSHFGHLNRSALGFFIIEVLEAEGYSSSGSSCPAK